MSASDGSSTCGAFALRLLPAFLPPLAALVFFAADFRPGTFVDLGAFFFCGAAALAAGAFAALLSDLLWSVCSFFGFFGTVFSDCW